MSTLNTAASVIALANAAHLTTELVARIAGNEISNHLQGSPVTRDTLHALSLAAIQRSLEAAHVK